jgi:hypothetical protein
VLTFGTNTNAQGNNKATAEIFGVLKGADGAPVVLHLRALDDNPVRYYDGSQSWEFRWSAACSIGSARFPTQQGL